MTDAAGHIAPVDEAEGWALSLLRKHHKGPGDTVEAAMHRVAIKHRIDRQTLWKLRYRKPKDIMATAYLAIKSAYEAECARQEAKLAHELELTKQMRGPHEAPSTAEVEAKALLAARDHAPEA